MIFAPYETYLDDLLGVKTSYGAAVLIRNEAESQQARACTSSTCPTSRTRCRSRPRTGPRSAATLTPMEVMDAPFRAGDLRHGYQAVADNLPNDPRIHQEKGTKKIFFKNFMDARVERRHSAARRANDGPGPGAPGVGAKATWRATVMHEISHGLGPGVRAARRPAGGYPRSHRPALLRARRGQGGRGRHVRAEVAGGPRRAARRIGSRSTTRRTWRASSARCASAPAKRTGAAEMMEFNYLAEQGAIVRQTAAGTASTTRRCRRRSSAGEGTARAGSHRRSRAGRGVVRKYDTMPDGADAALAAAKDVPIDVDPIVRVPRAGRVGYSLPEGSRSWVPRVFWDESASSRMR